MRTVREIRHAVDTYYKDMAGFPELLRMNAVEFFDYVKNIPYVRDVPDLEIVSRPKYLLTIFPSLDCKKKSILMASFMRYKHGPGSYRFVLSSNRPDGQIGHIFTQVKCNGQWINADATYSNNNFAAKKRVTNYQIVEG